MKVIATLPVLFALSGTPTAPQPAPQAAEAKADTKTAQVGTITCPLTGDEIPSCCCPVK